MITISTTTRTYGVRLVRYDDVRCLSTDTKPAAKIHNGSTCVEVDTGKKYLFDGDSKTWNEITGSAIISANGVDF